VAIAVKISAFVGRLVLWTEHDVSEIGSESPSGKKTSSGKKQSPTFRRCKRERVEKDASNNSSIV
jgi:hypothetical protein